MPRKPKASQATNDVWEDRIVGTGRVDPKELAANPLNARVHELQQERVLLSMLKRVGVVAPVTVNETTGLMLDGHLRVALALRTGQPAIPVTYVRLTEQEERQVLATFDPITSMAGYDPAVLGTLIANLGIEDEGLLTMLSSLGADPLLTVREMAGGDKREAVSWPTYGAGEGQVAGGGVKSFILTYPAAVYDSMVDALDKLDGDTNADKIRALVLPG
jgi:hypothetical protein